MSKAQRDHNEGQKDGSKSVSSLDDWITELNPFVSKDYKQGFHHGYENRPKEGDSSNESSSDSSKSSCVLSSACAKAIGLPDDCDELMTLRHFRDSVLSSNSTGESILEEYYRVAPGMVESIESKADSILIYKKVYEHLIAPITLLIKKSRFNEAITFYKIRFSQLREALDLYG